MTTERPDLSRVDIKWLIERDVALRYIAQTNGGEFAGPCPFCGTGDDRFRVWPDHPDGRGRYWCRVCNRMGDAIDYLCERDQLTFPEALEELRLYEGASIANQRRDYQPSAQDRLVAAQKSTASGQDVGPRYSRRETVARYTYVDEDGIPLYQVRRVHFYDENGQRLDKQFYQYRWADNQWQRGLKDTRRVLYRLPRVLAAVEAGETVYVVEGEKCVHALEELGLTATCNPMGARKWQPEYSLHLKDADAVILPDADDDGLDHAERVAESLIDVARSVKVVELPGLEHSATHGLDVADWLANTANTYDRLLAIVQAASHWNPADAPVAPEHTSKEGPLEADPFSLPPLPPYLDLGNLESERGQLSSNAWLSAYDAYAAQISPTTPRLFHESAGLWAVSTIIARRLWLSMSFADICPNLCIAWTAPPVLFNRTTAMNIARRLVADTAPHLLAPEMSTPDELFALLAGEMSDRSNRVISSRRREAGSRQRNTPTGWAVDDLAGTLSEVEMDSGWIDTLGHLLDAALVGYWRRPSSYVEIREAYLSVIGGGSFTSLSGHINNEHLWSNGWWPHFALLTPEEDIPTGYGSSTPVERPPILTERLAQLNNALPQPNQPRSPESAPVSMEENARELWEIYNKAVRHDLLIAAIRQELRLDRRLFHTYGRLPVQGLKVATLLAALDRPDSGEVTIRLAHIQQALRIMERWRASAHRTLRRCALSEK